MSTSQQDLKHAQRQQMRSLRRAISPTARVVLEERWLANALSSGWFYPTQKLAAYLACGSELNLQRFISLALARGILVYLPRVVGQQPLDFCRFQGQALQTGAFGIAQPNGPAVAFDAIDIILVPLLAIDMRGRRLGQGGGYYDRTLAHASAALRVGVAFDEQCLQSLPNEAFDQPMDALITPSGVQVFTQNHRAANRFPVPGLANRP